MADELSVITVTGIAKRMRWFQTSLCAGRMVALYKGAGLLIAQLAEADASVRRLRSVCVLAAEDAEYGHRDDLQIEGETPIPQIVKIVFHSFSN